MRTLGFVTGCQYPTIVMPCFLNKAVVWSRNRECSRSIELPSRTVYVLNSKHRDSLATFLISAGRFGPHGGVGAAAGAPPRPADSAPAPCRASINVPVMKIQASPVEQANTNPLLMLSPPSMLAMLYQNRWTEPRG